MKIKLSRSYPIFLQKESEAYDITIPSVCHPIDCWTN
jgi:hypothetical protein